ncbi:type II toxin-antitoxin system VapC family toxin [Chlorobium sp. BLA1]|uniref:type II toxin-antitoxin system VapC family toxin n=1 Tax=Candidatus Chlorobium masyuteum TaxID=2716876 RepID=UPI0014243535|nr:type II toxin-antitoxin system VapC family toxin [Candidatus Chlorobium masyuteum]NHQ61237.1 type II toxin-antitoxin system VapC family toxin [Candidatus Chlorobium masyuteum]
MGGREGVITVDTHIILWDALQPELLSNKAKSALQKANDSDGILFCSISLWEIAMLMKKKRVEIDLSYVELIDLLKAANNYVFQEITPEIAQLSATLPASINSDPADRIISASSLVTQTPLVTADRNLRAASMLHTIW